MEDKDKENKVEEEIPREEIQAYIKERWSRMWSTELIELRNKFKQYREDPELIRKLSEKIVKETGE